MWAADGKRFAFVNIASDSVQLWIGDASTGSVKQVPGVHLNPMFNEEMQWMPDQKTLLVKLVPKSNDGAPQEVNELSGPSIQETSGQKGPSSTYEARDTLRSAHDENLFDYFALSQLAFVDSATFVVTPFGKPANYNSLAPAPDGHHILVTTIHRPYSYLVTYDRFPKEVEVWDTSNGSNFHRSHGRIASDGRSRSHSRRSHRPTRFFLAVHRARDTGLGRSPRRRRLEG